MPTPELGNSISPAEKPRPNLVSPLQTPLDGLKAGTEMTGVVTRMMLHHGAQVDLGAQYDG